MRPGPESSSPPRPRKRCPGPVLPSWPDTLRNGRRPARLLRRGPLLILTVLLLAVPVQAALAQGGSGAERYEVTITPPKRPGSPTGAAEDAPAPAPRRTGEPRSPGDPGVADTRPATDHVLGASEPAPGDSGNKVGDTDGKPRSAAVAAVPPASARIDPNLPRRSLQVGAFRQRSLATAMQDKLEASFPDVSVVEVQSGGTPLFRVNVGRLPKGAELSRLKDRLADSGYPSFDVPAPPVD